MPLDVPVMMGFVAKVSTSKVRAFRSRSFIERAAAVGMAARAAADRVIAFNMVFSPNLSLC